MKGLYQSGCLEGCHQGGEATISNGGLNNVLFHDSLFSRGKEHGIDHMDDAIGGFDVGDDDLDIIIQVH